MRNWCQSDRSSTSIIIPVHDDTEGLRTTLNSLSVARLINDDIEVIVCNDGGDTSVSGVVADFGVREVVLSINSGSYAARNAGIEASKGEVLVFLDADQIVSPDWLANGLAALTAADYVGGRVVVVEPKHPTHWHAYNAYTGFPVADYIAHLHFAPTANLFVKRQVFEDVGMFDARLRSSGDLEFGQRVHGAGIGQAFSFGATTYHPARDRAEMLRKARRTGIGHTEFRLLINNESPLAVALSQLRLLLLLPASWVNRSFFSRKFRGLPFSPVRIAAADAIFRMRYHSCALLRAVMALFNSSRPNFESQVRPCD